VAGGTGNPTVNSLANTILALNSAAAGPDVFGTFASRGHNLIGSSAGASGFAASDRTGVTAAQLNLGPLQSNGGPVPTDALLPGSVAVDAGDATLVPGGVLTDARGAGFTRVFVAFVDVGAFELQ
jgi:hypothetical protein